MAGIAYCGTPPEPGSLLARFNTDPVLLVCLALGALLLWRMSPGRSRPTALAGWGVAGLALVSPLCALSVSLFAARVGQHMLLILIAAPMLAAGLPARASARGLGLASLGFCLALWFWHMPRPYDATFVSTPLYWTMHLTLFGSAVLLWRQLLDLRSGLELASLAAGTFAAIQMGLLGAILTLSARPLFAAHALTTDAWGLARLEDQQLGGLIMWVPGGLLFGWLALRAVAVLLRDQGTSKAGNA